MTPKEAAEFLNTHDRYLILTHVRPDGDTIGCAAGLCRALRLAGKQAYVLENPEATSLFTPYMEGLLAPQGYEPETVVAVDMAVAVLMGDAVGVHVLMAVRLTVLQRHPCLFFLAHAASPFLCSFPEQMMM